MKKPVWLVAAFILCAAAYSQVGRRTVIWSDTVTSLLSVTPGRSDYIGIVKGILQATNRDGIVLIYDPVATDVANNTNIWAPYTVGAGPGRWFLLIENNGPGSVANVGLDMPADGFIVTGSPVIGSGVLTVNSTNTGILKGSGDGYTNAVPAVDYVAPGLITTSGLTATGTNLIGRYQSGTGVIQLIDLGAGLSISNSTLSGAINPTDLFLPMRTNNTFFDSKLKDAAVGTGFWDSGVEQFRIGFNGAILSGKAAVSETFPYLISMYGLNSYTNSGGPLPEIFLVDHQTNSTSSIDLNGRFPTPALTIGHLTNSETYTVIVDPYRIYLSGNSTTGLVSLAPYETFYGDAPFTLESQATTGTNTLLVRHAATNAFRIDRDSGYLGTGTNILTDNGRYRSLAELGITPSSSTNLWEYSSGTLRPIADPTRITIGTNGLLGLASSRTLFAPTVVNGATANAAIIDSVNTLSFTSGAKSLAVRNNATNQFFVRPDGALFSGRAVATTGNPTGATLAIQVARQRNQGDSSRTVVQFQNVADGSFTDYSDAVFNILSHLTAPTSDLQLSAFSTTNNSSVYFNTRAAYAGTVLSPQDRIGFDIGGTTRLDLRPSAPDLVNSIAYKFDVPTTLTANGTRLFSLQTAGIERAGINGQGHITSGTSGDTQTFIQAAPATGSNVNGINLILAAGQSTGSGEPGTVIIASGGAKRVNDTQNSGIQTRYRGETYRTPLTNNVATEFILFDSDSPTESQFGAKVIATAWANDGINYQMQTTELLLDVLLFNPPNPPAISTYTLTTHTNATVSTAGSFTTAYSVDVGPSEARLLITPVSSLNPGMYVTWTLVAMNATQVSENEIRVAPLP